MPAPSDYKDLLRTLNKRKVRYLIVGAYAVIYYTEPRYTKDLDIWVDPEDKNAEKVYKALKEYGAPLKGITSLDFKNRNLVYQIGMAPVRVDVMMGISGAEFKKAWQNKKTVKFDGVKVNIIGICELITAKKKTRRAADLLDVENLRIKMKIKKQNEHRNLKT